MRTTMTAGAQALRAIWLGLSGGALALALALGVLLVVVPKATGSVPLTVNTGSMAPALPVGTLLVDRPTSADTVQIGDVITYLNRDQQPVTHRVVGVISGPQGLEFRTQGDANGAADPIVQAAQVRAKVWYSVPLLGWVNSLVNAKQHPVLLYLAVAPLFGYGVVQLVRATRRKAPAAALAN